MKILLAIDGSKFSEAAVDVLVETYKPATTEVLVLHVVESNQLVPVSYGFELSPTFFQDYAAIAEQLRKEGETLVSSAVKRLEAAGFKAIAKVEEGSAKDTILDCAKTWNPDLILMGSHGKNGLDRFLLGSVSEAVSRHAPCSVEIVRPMAKAA